MLAENQATPKEDVEMRDEQCFHFEYSPATEISPMAKIEKSGDAAKHNSFNENPSSGFVRNHGMCANNFLNQGFLKLGSSPSSPWRDSTKSCRPSFARPRGLNIVNSNLAASNNSSSSPMFFEFNGASL